MHRKVNFTDVIKFESVYERWTEERMRAAGVRWTREAYHFERTSQSDDFWEGSVSISVKHSTERKRMTNLLVLGT